MTKERTRRLAAVWFADIVGYTRLSAKDEDAALAVVDELQEITLKVVEKSGGRVVKFMGDGVLSVFDSANTALSSALILQEAFHASEVATTHSCSLSVGVHLGEVVEASDGDIYGDGVNTAARIEGVARAGQVVLSEDVFRQIRNRAAYEPKPLGEHTLKGLSKPLPLYVLGAEPEPGQIVAPGTAVPAVGAAAGKSLARPSKRSSRPIAIGSTVAVMGFLLLTVAIGFSIRLGEDEGGEGETATDPTTEAVSDAAPGEAQDPVTGGETSQPRGGGDTESAPASETPTPPPPDAAADGGAEALSVTATPADPDPALPEGGPPGTEPDLLPAFLVVVYGDGPAARRIETGVVRSLRARRDVRALDLQSLAISRPDAPRIQAAMAGDLTALAQLGRRSGAEFLFVGDMSTSVARAAGPFLTGSAELSFALYRVSTGEVLRRQTFQVGHGGQPGKPGRTEADARAQAAQAVTLLAATAARRWLAAALR